MEKIENETQNKPNELWLNRPITFSEVEKATIKAKGRKAVGIDNIPNELLKNDIVMDLMLKLFRVCFEYQLVPEIWHKSMIHPIPKDVLGSNDPLKYRGLALQSCIYKIFSSIITDRIVNFLEQENLLEETQNGFRKNRSCAHHIYVLTTFIRHKLNLNQSIFSGFVDFRKAFDVVDREMLYNRLATLGVTGNILGVVRQVYRETKNVIRLNDTLSPEFVSETDLQQGDNLSPTGFNMFINNLLYELCLTDLGVTLEGSEKLSVLTYADDIVLLAENEKDLQSLFNCLHQWGRKWRILVNINKTKVVHFRKKNQNVTRFVFQIGNTILEKVSQY